MPCVLRQLKGEIMMRIIHDHDEDQNSLSIAQITAALLETVGILRKLLVAALLHTAEKVECTSCDSTALS